MKYPEKAIFFKNISEIENYKEVIEALKKFKNLNVWKGNIEERKKKFLFLHKNLCKIYNINVKLVFDIKKPFTYSFHSYYNKVTNTIVLKGRFSVITYLHEFAHALQYNKYKKCDEFFAVKYSLTLFKYVFPEKFEKLKSERHVLILK